MFYMVDTKTTKPVCLGLIIGSYRNRDHAFDVAAAFEAFPQFVLVEAEPAGGAKYLRESKLKREIFVKRDGRNMVITERRLREGLVPLAFDW